MTVSLNEGETSTRDDILARLNSAGYVLVPPRTLAALAASGLDDLGLLGETWATLPADSYLRDGGRYRFRRHSCFIQSLASAQLSAVPHRAHWQPTTYNALHGGIERWFEPIEPRVQSAPAWRQLLQGLGTLFAQLSPVDRWYLEAHQFRIDAANGIGRPTPEGAHRDGVDFVAVILVERHNVKGGETRVFDANGPAGTRFTMQQPWTALLMNDARVIHETTPIQPEADGRREDGRPLRASFRDTLVLTYRAGSFQAKPG